MIDTTDTIDTGHRHLPWLRLREHLAGDGPVGNEAASAAVADTLDPGTASVGTWIEVEHLAPTPIGADVVAVATLTRAEGGRLEFDLAVSEGGGAVARVRHRRQVVDRALFLDRLGRRTP